MLIDEFEEINSLVSIQKRRLFNDLRHLIDLNVANFSLIVACTPHGWETIYEENAALVRRFSSNVIFLEPLTNESAGDLIYHYLKDYRINLKEFKKFVLKNGYGKGLARTYPFTPKAIEEICSLAKGNTGEVLKYCGIAIELGVSKKLKLIDAEDFHSLIADYYSNN